MTQLLESVGAYPPYLNPTSIPSHHLKNRLEHPVNDQIMANTQSLPIPGVQHGARLVISVVDERAQTDPESPWVSVPVDEDDITKGYKEITYSQLSNAVNHAATGLLETYRTNSSLSPMSDQRTCDIQFWR